MIKNKINPSIEEMFFLEIQLSTKQSEFNKKSSKVLTSTYKKAYLKKHWVTVPLIVQCRLLELCDLLIYFPNIFFLLYLYDQSRLKLVQCIVHEVRYKNKIEDLYNII